MHRVVQILGRSMALLGLCSLGVANIRAQECQDSAAADTMVRGRFAVPSALKDSLLQLHERAKPVLPKKGPKGSVEGRLVMGRQPMTTSSSGAVNGAFKADLRQVVFGVPVRMDADLSTAAPVRGRRNRLRFSVDTEALAARGRVDATQQLDSVRRAIAKLKEEQAELDAPHLDVPELPSVRNVPDTLRAQGDLPSSQLDTLRPPSPAIDTIEVPPLPQRPPVNVDAERQRITALIDELSVQEQRLTALVSAQTRGRSDVLSSLRALELGECRPLDAEFLVRDLSVQGAHVQVQRNDLFVDALVGRSFDDQWRSTTADQVRLSALQQAAFFAPAQDLAPRKLASLIAGHGAPDGDHAHLGVLYGRKSLVPAGASVGEDAGELRNVVVQANAGLIIARDHSVRMVLARSSDKGVWPSANAAAADEEGSTSKASKDKAASLTWRSEFKRLGSSVELRGRTVGAEFHSLGMGFLRPGSKELSVQIAQRFGREVQVRAKGSTERRVDPITGSSMRIARGQLAFNWRPSSVWSFTGTAQPIMADSRTASGTSLHQENLVVGAGTTYRKRIRTTYVMFTAQVDRYQLGSVDSTRSDTWWTTSSVAVQWNQGSSVSFSGAGPIGSSRSGGSLSGNMSLRIGERTTCTAYIATDPARPQEASYGSRLQRQLGKGIWIAGAFDRFSASGDFFPEVLGADPSSAYNCGIIIILSL